jgi:hypothetical protein
VMATTLEEELSPPCLVDLAGYISMAEEEAEFQDLEQEVKPETSPVELKQLPPELSFVFLNGNHETPVIISDKLSNDETQRLVATLEKYWSAIGYCLKDLKGIRSRLCTHRIPMEQDHKAVCEHQRRLNNAMREVVKEVLKPLKAGVIYLVFDSEWISPVQVVLKKGGMTVIRNEKNKLLPQQIVTSWRMCINYRKLSKATRKDHFPLPFIDEMLEGLINHSFYYLNGYSGYHHIPIHPNDQSKTTFTCPYDTFAYRRMSFGMCNALASFQRCMMAIFFDLIEKVMEVFMDDFSVYGKTFKDCLANLDKVLKRCQMADLVLNWEKCHFMVRDGTILGHKILEKGIEVDKEKIEVIEQLLPPTNVKGIHSFLRLIGFYRRFIQNFSQIAQSLVHLLAKDAPFVFTEECLQSFHTLKKALIFATIIQPLDWHLPFEIMCDASDYAIGVMLGQSNDKKHYAISYTSKTLTGPQLN